MGSGPTGETRDDVSHILAFGSWQNRDAQQQSRLQEADDSGDATFEDCTEESETDREERFVSLPLKQIEKERVSELQGRGENMVVQAVVLKEEKAKIENAPEEKGSIESSKKREKCEQEKREEIERK